MKKVYTKPNMEVVSLKTENIITASAPLQTSNLQTTDKMKTIQYY